MAVLEAGHVPGREGRTCSAGESGTEHGIWDTLLCAGVVAQGRHAGGKYAADCEDLTQSRLYAGCQVKCGVGEARGGAHHMPFPRFCL